MAAEQKVLMSRVIACGDVLMVEGKTKPASVGGAVSRRCLQLQIGHKHEASSQPNKLTEDELFILCTCVCTQTLFCTFNNKL